MTTMTHPSEFAPILAADHFKSASSISDTMTEHVDVDLLIEEYAWRYFRDIQSLKKTRLDEFKNLERDDVEFIMNRKKLTVVHEEPEYSNLQTVASKPFTLFKSVFTNSTNRAQEYSFKTERSTESVCLIGREQGYCIGAEAELTLKTPCEIAELKAGFKHEMSFNNLSENSKSETLTWGVDSNITVPAHYVTEASIIIEEKKYKCNYTAKSRLSGIATVSIRRRKDSALVLPVTVNIVEVFKENMSRKDVKTVARIAHNNTVELVSKGHCEFQFALKQRVDLKEKALTKDSLSFNED
uniref:Ig-like domain-containing protein n=1 Tax=Steinernema glaseri TaxID=37863 RepID=A0A1I7YVV8_9BILA